MKIAGAAISLFCFLLAGCNTVGPYTAKVYRLEASIFMVNVDTWLGSGNDSPTVKERLKRTTEALVKRELSERGLPVEKCVFMGFTSYQGGHMGITVVAGSALAVSRWAAMSEESFDNELRNAPLPQEVLKFEGRMEEVNPTSQPKHGEDQRAKE